MLVAAAVCPHPPLLVPQVAAGAARELDDLRSACDRAVAAVLAAEPGLVFLVGPGPARFAVGAGDSGSLASYGVELSVPLGPRLCAGAPVLPLSLTIGAWLLARSGWTGDRQGYVVPVELPAREAAAIGREVADLDERVGLLVLGDASARRGRRAPGYVHPRAAAYDADVARALGTGDVDALHRLDPADDDALTVGGRAAWQVLAGAAADGDWAAQLDYDAAPYGVGYLVARWTRR